MNDDVGNVDGVGNFPALFDAPDPTFNPPTALLQWEQVSGAGDAGSLVYIVEIKGATTLVNPPSCRTTATTAASTTAPATIPCRARGRARRASDTRVLNGYCAAAGKPADCHVCRTRAESDAGPLRRRLTLGETQGAYGSHGIHYFVTNDTDNAASPGDAHRDRRAAVAVRGADRGADQRRRPVRQRGEVPAADDSGPGRAVARETGFLGASIGVAEGGSRMRSRIRARAAGGWTATTSAWLWGCLLLLAQPAEALSIRTVAITGETGSGTSGATYTTFGLSTLNSSGQVSFTALLEQTGGVDATNDLGVWSEGSGALGLVARRGSGAPGTAGDFESFISPPTISDAGKVSFRAFLQEEPGVSTANNEGLWSEIPTSLSLVAREGSQAAGVALGQNYASAFSDPTSSETQVAYNSSLLGGGTTTADNRALWAGTPGSPSLVARKGDVAAGVLDGATYESFAAPVINESGAVAFRAPLDVGDDALFTGPAGLLQLLAREGQGAPGTAGQFAAFQSPDLNDSGSVAFAATLGGVAAGSDSGIWVGGPGSLALVAQEGDLAPDAGGARYASFSTPLLNQSDEAAFHAFLDNGGVVIVLDGASGPSKVAATGDVAPGTDLGAGQASFSILLSPAFNDSGQVAFEAFLEGALAGVTVLNDEALYATDASGDLLLIVREGDLFERRPGDFAIVNGIDLFVDPESRGRSLNDSLGGQLTFHLSFVDGGEGIFVTTIPEPASGALLGLSLAALGAARRRSRRIGLLGEESR